MPSSSLSMASVTILILDRYRSSTGLPALVPGVFLSSFLPLPCVRLSLLSFPTPDFLDCPHLWFSSLLSCTSAAWSSGTVCVFPPKGSVPFSPASPVASFPFLASGYFHVGSTAVSSSTDDSTVPRSPFGSRFYLSDFADSVVVARGFAEARPHHSPGAAKSTGQATANKPFAQYHVYSGNEGH